ncbi:hypothetical protein [Amycolatopsis nigrescens]|uniref:hypothetical protein n=1 Tax=Amycolatopsis nigrescens TaxID=381445 RepID=UPI00036DE707|nr:hypothetical protein [Amycolatopsis nigrescens]
MPVSSAVRERIRGFLEPADDIEYVFPADVLGSALPSVLVVVSRHAITVLSTGFWSRRRPKSVLFRSPRNVRLGPVDTQSTPRFTLHGVEYEVDEEYVSVINAADAELGSRDLAPPDPLPDL